MSALDTLKDIVLDWVFPQTCAHCREDLPKRWEGPLCSSCLKELKPSEPPFCLRCAEPVPSTRSHCRACSTRLFACRQVRAAFLYKGALPGVVHSFKYRGRLGAARAAGRWMARALPRFPELSGFDALVPVPLHPRRLAERGYNQAGLLATELSAAAGLPVLELLERRKPTAPQWSLDRDARRENLAGAFVAGAAAKGLKLLLIDDVCTSGSSLEGCAKALQGAGAASVSGYVLARQTQAKE